VLPPPAAKEATIFHELPLACDRGSIVIFNFSFLLLQTIITEGINKKKGDF
jgi:hypothetical protein